MTTVGSAEIELVPKLSPQFQAQAEAAINRATSRLRLLPIGGGAGPSIGNQFGTQIAQQISNSIAAASGRITPQITGILSKLFSQSKIGQAAGASFGKNFSSNFSQSFARIPTTAIGKFISNLSGGFGRLTSLARVFNRAFIPLSISFTIVRRAAELLQPVLGSIIEEFSDLEQGIISANAIFGEAAAGVGEFARSAQNVVQSEAQALKAANTFGELFVSLGEGKEQAAAFAVQATQLAQALSIFREIPVESAVQSLQTGLQGSVKAFRTLGIGITDFQVKTEAGRLRLLDYNGQVNELAGAQIRLQLALQRAGNLTDVVARSQGNFNIVAQQFQKNAQETGAALAGTVVPALREFLTLGSGVLRTVTSFAPAFRFFGEAVASALNPLRPFVQLLQQLNIIDTAEELALLAAEFDKTKSRIENHNRLVNEQFQVLQDTIRATRAYSQAQRDTQAAVRGIERAEESLEEARRDQARIPLQIAQAENQLAQSRLAQSRAVLQVARSAISLTRATNDLTDARQKLTDLLDPLEHEFRLVDAQLDYEQATLDAAKANEKLKNSADELADSTFSVFLATNKIIQLRRRGTASAAELVKAQLDLQKAQRQAREEELDATLLPLKARKAELDARKAAIALGRVDSEFNKDVRDAQLDIRDALLGVADAQIGIKDAALGVKSANLSVISSIQSVIDARHQEVLAARRVRDANQEVKDSIQKLRDAIFDEGIAREALDAQRDASMNRTRTEKERFDALVGTLSNLHAAFGPLIGEEGDFARIKEDISSMPRLEIADLEQIKKQKDGIKTGIDEIADLAIRRLNDIKQHPVIESLSFIGNPFAFLADLVVSSVRRRQHGGPVATGVPYLVGERGPELFVPKSSGQIIPNGASSGQVNNFYINSNQDGRVVANIIARRIVRRAL